MDMARTGNDEVVLEQLRAFVVENFLFGDAQRAPGDEESLMGAGIVDSTGVLEVVDFLETTLGVTVADHETVPGNLDTIEALARFVGSKRAA